MYYAALDATGSRHGHRQPVAAHVLRDGGRPAASGADAHADSHPRAGSGRHARRMSLKLERVHRLGRDQVVLRGDKLRVRGSVSPFVPGQRVTVRLYKGRSKLAAKSVLVKPAGANGAFLVSLKPRTGRLTVRASHRATPQQATFVAKPARVIGITPHASLGDRGPTVRLLQAASPTSATRSRAPAGSTRRPRAPSSPTARSGAGAGSGSPRATSIRGLLARRGAFKARYPGHGKHVEADLSRQVLVLLRGRKVDRIYSTSSGAA